MILLKAFASERGVSTDAVTAYIRRHKKEFEGHTKKVEKRLLIDDEAIIKLDKIYPLPRPIEIVGDTETQRKLIKIQEMYIELQEKYRQNERQIAIITQDKMSIEEHNKTMQEEIEKARQEIERARQEIDHLKEQNDRIQEKYETELRKTWWDKLRGK